MKIATLHQSKFRIALLPFSVAMLLPISAPVSAELIDEITVTATKREENLQDVSVSVTAFSGEVMRDIGLTSSNDLGQYVPGVEIAAVNGNQTAKTFIRGSGSVDFNANAQTTVGVYSDEVYLTNIYTHTLQTFDLDRIEALRGPQGTLYGRNATAGAVNYVSAKPEEEFSGYVKGSIGNYGSRHAEAAITGALAKTVAGRLSFTYNQDDGWMTNRLTGDDDLNDTDNYAWRGILLWSPSETTRVLFNLHGSNDEANGFSLQHTGVVDPNTFATTCDPTKRKDCVDFFGYQDPDGIEEDGDTRKGDFDLVGPTDYETLGGYVRIEWELEDFTVTSITAYEEFERTHIEDADASPNLISHNDYQHETDGWSQELRFTSTTDGALAWILGFYYAEDSLDSENIYNFFGFNTFQFYDQDQESMAVFGNLEYELNDELKLIFGARYTRDEVDLNHRSDDDFGPFDAGTSGDDTYTDFSGKVGLDYTPNENLLIYASIGTGYKSGGVNVGFGDPLEFNVYDEETLTAYEAGFKYTFPSGNARLNTSFFYYDYKDLQIFDQTQGTFGLAFIIDNASDADYYGGEIEFVANPFEGLDLLMGVSYLNTEFGDLSRPLTGEDLSGNENVYSPKWKLTGLARYEWQSPNLNDGKFVASVNWSWTDEVFHTIENLDIARGKAHWLVGSRLSYFTSDEKLEIALWGKNLTEAEYRLQSFDFTKSGGFVTSVPNRPRSYGIEIVYNW